MAEEKQEEKKLEPIVVTEPKFTEAPGIAFTKLFWQHDGQSGEINADLRYGFSLLDPSIQKGPGKVSDIQTPTNQRIANVGIDKKVAPVPAGTKQVDATPKNQEQNGIIQAVLLEIQPVKDGKISLNWLASGHKYADIYTTRTAEKALELLQSFGEAWDESHLLAYGKYDVAHNVYYRLSDKMNTKGNPYKDIVEIRTRD